MTQLTRKILVVDHELTMTEDLPAGCTREIIEFGWCWLDTLDLTISEPLSVFVRPQQGKKTVGENLRLLTGITWEDLKSAPPLDGACNHLIEHGTRQHGSMAWGLDISRMPHYLEQHALLTGRTQPKNPYGEHTINLQLLVAAIRGKGVLPSLRDTVNSLDIKWPERRHRAGADAWVTAHVAARVLQLGRKF